MSSILEIFFPLCASDTIRWQRRTPDVEDGIWPDVADDANEQLQQWLQTDAIRLYIPGEWISVWQVELPDVARKQIPTILPALLEEELNQDIDELHFAPLKIDQQLATVAVIHQQHMRPLRSGCRKTASPALPSRRTGCPFLVDLWLAMRNGLSAALMNAGDGAPGWRWLRSCSAPSSMSRIYRFR